MILFWNLSNNKLLFAMSTESERSFIGAIFLVFIEISGAWSKSHDIVSLQTRFNSYFLAEILESKEEEKNNQRDNGTHLARLSGLFLHFYLSFNHRRTQVFVPTTILMTDGPSNHVRWREQIYTKYWMTKTERRRRHNGRKRI